MKICAVRIFVNDWMEACDSYGNTLGLPLEFSEKTFGWAEFDVGGAKFGIERVDPGSGEAEQARVGRFVGVSLQVDDARETYQQLAARGVEFESPPEKQHWGGVLAHFKDPSGTLISLMSEGR